MRIVGSVILPLLALCGCENAEARALRERAESLGNALLELRELNKREARRLLEPFIEPSDLRDERIALYYESFSAKSAKYPVIGQSVERVRIARDGETAEVTYRVIALAAGDTPISAWQTTEWKRIDGEWYRAAAEARKGLGGVLATE